MEGGTSMRILSLSAVGPQGTQRNMLVNLAGALVEQGCDVLVLDDGPVHLGVAAALGLSPRLDLGHVIRREHGLDEVIQHGPGGLRVLPLGQGLQGLARLPQAQQQRLLAEIARQAPEVDSLLLAGRPGLDLLASPPPQGQRHLLAMAGGGATTITGGYAAIKHLATSLGQREFHVLMSDVASEEQARTIFGNLARTARRHLQASLSWAGHVPSDDALARSARLRLPVVAAFPRTAAAEHWRGVARALSAWPATGQACGGFDAFLRRLLDVTPLQTEAVPG